MRRITPSTLPPDELHTYEDLTDDSPVAIRYRAMIEAMDTEMGRLFDSIPAEVLGNTHIIFLGDNGTPVNVTLPPFDPAHAKPTLYEGGINVPMIISGPRVASPGREEQMLINTVDLFATALELMGVDIKESGPYGVGQDSRSLLPVLTGEAYEPREFAYSELFDDPPTEIHGQAIRNDTFKLIRFTTLGTEEFYDLSQDPFETTRLLFDARDPAQQAAYDSLTLAIDLLTAEPCAGDANVDGTVGPLDYGFVLARYGCAVEQTSLLCDLADQNGDGVVDPLDTGYVLARFGPCP